MAADGAMSSYRRGIRDGLPFIVMVGPFGLLFGVVATEAGLSVFESLTFSIVVIAGASQFTALQLMQDNAPTLVVLGSALAVNLRMAMYSASITPHLGALPFWKRAVTAYFMVDQTYAGSILEYERRTGMSVGEKFAYFMGMATPICPAWYILTLVGALVGGAIPEGIGLDFALPLAFIAMVAPALRTPNHVVAMVTAVVASLLFAWLPYNLGLIVAGLAGMMAGAEMERRRGA
ncbi:AzlC family ABC transporter permease [Allosediminivita pacifica]|uniref:Putative branched-subunit amino acid permease n=1 Tax=Allosediminivita pacifica TaxID=1267769 RepID=A0A2T6B3N5_9RHOB|nr:putative branched-subunit amino acid permease [Allosediminivita pacifica]GGB00424.1 branched-chain amino acid transporter AzlC [Allosediminivita pacifica]